VARETIARETGFERIRLSFFTRECGEILVRGGTHFARFSPVVFVGSMRNGFPVERHVLSIGLRMKFYFDEQVVITSAVREISRRSTAAPATDCAAT
jgi:hypothetical protein